MIMCHTIDMKNLHVAAMLGDNDGVVFDPYCGSGTTLAAAKLLGKEYVGIDISAEYVDYAKQRMDNSIAERKAVEEELQKHYVQKTFKQRKENGEYTGKFKNADMPLPQQPMITPMPAMQALFNNIIF